jgi:hypothetical protein
MLVGPPLSMILPAFWPCLFTNTWCKSYHCSFVPQNSRWKQLLYVMLAGCSARGYQTEMLIKMRSFPLWEAHFVVRMFDYHYSDGVPCSSPQGGWNRLITPTRAGSPTLLTRARRQAPSVHNMRVQVFLHETLFLTLLCSALQAHIHRGPAGGTGGVVVWLYPVGQTSPANPPAGEVINGVLAQVGSSRILNPKEPSAKGSVNRLLAQVGWSRIRT